MPPLLNRGKSKVKFYPVINYLSFNLCANMDSSGRKSEFMKPIILKAGIPLAVSLGGIIYSLLVARRNSHIDNDSSEGGREEALGLNSTSHSSMEEEEELNENHQAMGLEEEMSGLMNQVRALQDRERDLKTRFLFYCGLKEHELAVTKLKHKLVLEQARVEFLGIRIDSIKAENQRTELMMVEYLKILKQLDSTKVENGLLRKKAKKLGTERRKYASIAHRQASALHAMEAEIVKNHEELHGKGLMIVESNGEIIALKKLVDQLQEEKNELAGKLKSMESSVSCASEKNSEETMLTELEQLRKERMAEAEELIYLRWINACFRHELTRNQELHGNEDEQMDHVSDASSTTMDHGESCAFIMTGTGSHSKPKFLGKLRRWAKGGKGLGHKHGRAQTIPHVKPRKSCSSV